MWKRLKYHTYSLCICLFLSLSLSLPLSSPPLSTSLVNYMSKNERTKLIGVQKYVNLSSCQADCCFAGFGWRTRVKEYVYLSVSSLLASCICFSCPLVFSVFHLSLSLSLSLSQGHARMHNFSFSYHTLTTKISLLPFLIINYTKISLNKLNNPQVCGILVWNLEIISLHYCYLHQWRIKKN